MNEALFCGLIVVTGYIIYWVIFEYIPKLYWRRVLNKMPKVDNSDLKELFIMATKSVEENGNNDNSKTS